LLKEFGKYNKNGIRPAFGTERAVRECG